MRHSVMSIGVETAQGLFAFPSRKTETIIKNLEFYKHWDYPELGPKTDPDIFKQRSYEIACINELELLVRLNPEMSFRDIYSELMAELEPSYESTTIPVETHEIVSVFMDVLYDISFLAKSWFDIELDGEWESPH